MIIISICIAITLVGLLLIVIGLINIVSSKVE